jgi:hypothetical protein
LFEKLYDLIIIELEKKNKEKNDADIREKQKVTINDLFFFILFVITKFFRTICFFLKKN